MNIRFVLFDLDGTLLPMDLSVFVKDYFGRLAKSLAPHGYESEKLIGAVWAGTNAMVKNDGSTLNETAFWNKFCEIYGEEAKKDMPLFEEFYEKDFPNVRSVCGYDPRAAEIVAMCKKLGLKVVLATNPIFPAAATDHRISWAGLNKADFEFVTTYENSRHCKPNPEYYKDVAEKLGANPCECLMVGNNVSEDMIAETLGMKVFLLTDCIINKEEKDISAYPHGSFGELADFIKLNI